MTADPALPERIGPYRVVRLLGEGAMGRVYLALEEHPAREVALKVLRLGGPALARFQREAQLLARLEHPGIARLYAAGSATTESGALPWLAMEYVRGEDLLSHARRLALPGRLRLLADVARAVHYAHTRGVIHRDLKPSNILVDERGQPRVLDFGVAHVVDAGDDAQMTVAGQVLGTLPYMSPEQLGGGRVAVDPRSDVYSLGAIAYELVGGRLPHPELAQASLLDALALLQARTPERLSRLEPAAAGDVETVIMKALAPDPAQRYGSAAELASDLERILAQQPVDARPPTVGYVAGLFVRRHKAVAAGAAIGLLGLVAAAVLALSFAVREASARREAEARSAESAAINAFLAQMLTAADPQHTRGEKLTVRELLDEARRTLAGDATLPPGVAAALRVTMAETYMNLGLIEPSLQLNSEVIAQPQAGADSRLRAGVGHAMGLVYTGNIGQADKEMQALLPQLKPAQGEAQKLRISSLTGYAVIQLEQGKLAEGEAFLRKLLAESESTLGPIARETLDVEQNLAAVLQALGKLDEAVKLQEDLVQRYGGQLGMDHPATLFARAWLSMMYRDRADPRAEETVRAVFADRQRLLGPDHPDTLQSQATLLSVLLLAQRFDEAEPMARELLDRNLRLRGGAHLDTLLTRNQLGDALLGRSRAAAAEEQFRQVRAAGEVAAHPLALSDGLGIALMEQGRLADARREFDQLLERTRAALPPDHPKLAKFMSSAGECARRRGDLAAARALLEPAAASLAAKYGATHPAAALAAQRLAAVAERNG